jgi:hypothetical protein
MLLGKKGALVDSLRDLRRDYRTSVPTVRMIVSRLLLLPECLARPLAHHPLYRDFGTSSNNRCRPTPYVRIRPRGLFFVARCSVLARPGGPGVALESPRLGSLIVQPIAYIRYHLASSEIYPGPTGLGNRRSRLFATTTYKRHSCHGSQGVHLRGG